MDRIEKVLTDYVIRKGMVDEADREIYEYGFTITAEVGLFALFSLFMALYLHMFAEGILFFIIFVPLRSYGGGLHLEKYHLCYILSCLTFSGILLVVRYSQIPIYFSFITLFLLEAVVYSLYPVENVNREVDKEEDKYFRKKLKWFLVLDIIIAAICVVLRKDKYILLIATTFLMIVITMIMGKYKNRKREMSNL
ncbi:accessory gene regulator ArgB-like protein [Anaerosporobacter sp.]|uniref:accessory gene regulator ArgB-like protein n=1 Tax=Anaerosporobacter sp. TaxID=1872529 RepID=UPI00286F102E|nr:accessory gene regulator B family protein [Anaerosporobacter sp.]